jgi:hypothetical protein
MREFAERHEYLAATGFFVVVVCIWFWPLLIGHQMGESHILYSSWPWMADKPADLSVHARSGEGDSAVQLGPLLELARHQIRSGQLPLWNPHIYAGMPLFANLQSALLYPLTWIGLLLPVGYAWGLIAALKLVSAGLGAYVFARVLRIGRGGALVAGLVYMLSAPVLAWLQWPLGTVFSLFPWLLLATHRLYVQPGARRLAALALVIMLSVFAGHAETALLSSSAAAVYLVALMVVDRRFNLRVALQWVGGHLLGAAVAAVVLVPFLAQYSHSITRQVHGDLSGLHLPPSSALLYALPNVYGNGKPEYFGPLATYVTTAAYFGVAALLLAGVGLFRNRRQAPAIALAAMAVVAGCVAFGIPPVSLIMRHVPPYSSGNVVRVLYIVSLAGAVGAGAGFASLCRASLPWRQIAFWGGGLLALVLAFYLVDQLADRLPAPGSTKATALVKFGVFFVLGVGCLAAVGRLRPRLALPFVLVVLALDMAYLQNWNVILPSAQAYPPRPALADFLGGQREPFRVSSIRPGPFPPYVLPPDTNALYRIDSIQGYDYPELARWADFSWFVLGEHGVSREIILNTPVPKGPALAGLRMMNTRYYLTVPGAPPPNPTFQAVYRGRDGSVYQDPDALPRTWIVPATRPLAYDQSLALLEHGGLDPRREALVPPGAPPPGPLRARPAIGSLRYERVSPDHVRIQLPPAASGWLVVADAYSPSWKASVDGHDAKLYPTNFAAMGLPVREGMHTIDLRYRRTGIWAGLGVSVAALLLMGFLARRREGVR